MHGMIISNERATNVLTGIMNDETVARMNLMKLWPCCLPGDSNCSLDSYYIFYSFWRCFIRLSGCHRENAANSGF